MNINTKTILDLWNSHEGYRSKLKERMDAYSGEHSKKSFPNVKVINESARNDVPISLLDTVIDAHVALNTTNPYQYVTRDKNADQRPVEALRDLKRNNHLDTIDSQHFLNCLIYGSSVELHSFTSDIRITKYDPRAWVLVRDEAGVIRIAILRHVAGANTIFENEFLTKDRIFFTVYTDTEISVFEELKDGLALRHQSEHIYGQVPIVTFKVNEDETPFLKDSLIQLNEALARMNNARMDEVEYVNSILAAIGFQNSAGNQSKIQAVKKEGAVILPKDSDLKWVSKSNDTEKYRQAIDDAREFLFMQGKLPDRKDVHGAISSLSGEAIKFLYQPTLQQAHFFQKFIKVGLRERIGLINRIWSLLNRPTLENFDINIDIALPVDLRSIAETAVMLKGTVSHRKQLEMIPGVDPEQELKRLQEEGQTVDEGQVSTPEPKQPIKESQAERQQARETVLETRSKDFAATLSSLLAERRKALSGAA